MKNIFLPLKATAQKEGAATAVAYAAVLALIAAVIIFSVSLVGEETRGAYEQVNNVLIEGDTILVEENKCKDSPDDPDCGIGND